MRSFAALLLAAAFALMSSPAMVATDTSYDAPFTGQTAGLAPNLDDLGSVVGAVGCGSTMPGGSNPPYGDCVPRFGPTAIAGDVTIQSQFPGAGQTDVVRLQSTTGASSSADFGFGNFGGGNPIPAGFRLARGVISMDVHIDTLSGGSFDIVVGQWNSFGGNSGQINVVSFGADGLIRVTDKFNAASVVSTYASNTDLGIDIKYNMGDKSWGLFINNVARHGGTLTNDTDGYPAPPRPGCAPVATPQLPQGCNGISGVDFDLGLASSGVNAVFLDNFLVTSTTTIPEPGTAALMSLGLAGFAWSRRRMR